MFKVERTSAMSVVCVVWFLIAIHALNSAPAPVAKKGGHRPGTIVHPETGRPIANQLGTRIVLTNYGVPASACFEMLAIHHGHNRVVGHTASMKTQEGESDEDVKGYARHYGVSLYWPEPKGMMEDAQNSGRMVAACIRKGLKGEGPICSMGLILHVDKKWVCLYDPTYGIHAWIDRKVFVRDHLFKSPGWSFFIS
jgi:hypothetical protein